MAIPNSGKFKIAFQCIKKWSSVFITSALLLVVSCAKNDDLEIIDNEATIVNNESSVNNNSTANSNSTTNNESTTNYDGSTIIYTDIEPDFTSANVGDFNYIDLNNDGVVDFTLKSIDPTWSFWCEPGSNSNNVNGFIGVSGPFESYVVPLNYKNPISSIPAAPYFFDAYGGYLAMDFCDTLPLYCSYGWGGKTNKYMGLRFLIDGQIHYGWVRLDVINPTHWAIKDYAYNATPNQPILAGQKD